MIAGVIAIGAVLAGCGSSASPSAATAAIEDAVVAVGDAPSPADGVGSLGDAVEVAAGALGEADSAACDADRRTVEVAVEAYTALNGEPPAGEDDLVAQQLLGEASTMFDLDDTAAIVPAPGGPCS